MTTTTSTRRCEFCASFSRSFLNVATTSPCLGDDAPFFAELTRTRLLPTLARASYRHGNRLARLGRFDDARSALRTALQATDDLLAHYDESRSKDNDESDDGPARTTTTTTTTREQETLLLSKEVFYELSNFLIV